MGFIHFSHNHQLMLKERIESSATCLACNDNFSCPGYTCSVSSRCKFYLHKHCAELPQEVQNPYHPHPLTLLVDEYYTRGSNGFRCNCCLRYDGGFMFHCKECNFKLDVTCALINPTKNEAQEQLHHITHLHPLVAIEKKHTNDDNDDNDCYCRICGLCISGAVYGCDPCNFYLHQSCAAIQLPETLLHFYHPCLLTLQLSMDESKCEACGNFSKVPYYSCWRCKFRIEVICALLPAKMESRGQEQIHHFSHGHPLKLRELEHGDEIICSACQKHCSGLTYVCCSSKCKYFLHSSCFDLPQNIRHLTHPRHPLTLYSQIQCQRRESEPICQVCYHFSHGFTYYCDICDFDIDVECPVMISTIKFQGHHHNIIFIDSLGPGLKEIVEREFAREIQEEFQRPCVKDEDLALCWACGIHCKSSSPIFRCVLCNFYLHLQCGPLPCLIKHESHMHPLALMDSPAVIEGEDKLDTDVFYCDTCEKERDPRLPIYYCCDGCAYLAALKCVLPEVMISLRGELGEVELKNTIWHKAGKVIHKGTVKGIELAEGGQAAETELGVEAGYIGFPSLTNDEREEFLNVLSTARNLKYQSTNSSTEELLFSDEAYTQFMKSLDTERCVSIEFWAKHKLIKVGDHLATWDMAPIFEDLYARYGDISAESNLKSSNVKMYFIMMLCGTIRSMCITRVADISKDLLFNWWKNLKAFQYAGFEVEFLFNRLKRVAHAYYGLQVVANKNLKEINKEIMKVSEDIEKLKAKLMAQTEILEALKEKRKIVESTKPGNPIIEAECVKEATVLKWMTAGDGLL